MHGDPPSIYVGCIHNEYPLGIPIGCTDKIYTQGVSMGVSLGYPQAVSIGWKYVQQMAVQGETLLSPTQKLIL
jgi:hypothetical protein